MFSHLRTINELVFYAGLSCLLAFFTRLYPVFFFPAFMLRIGVLIYCLYSMFTIRYRKPVLEIICIGVLLGWIGGYQDLIEVYFHFNPAEFVKNMMLAALVPILIFSLYLGKSRSW